MSSIFEDIELEWQGVPYRIRGDDGVMKAIAVIEDHVTLFELTEGQSRGSIPLAKVSRAYAAVLRLAGARVTDAEVYGGMWADGANADLVQQALGGLLEMMVPPSAIEAAEQEADGDSGNANSPGKGKAAGKGKAKKSSGQRTKRQS